MRLGMRSRGKKRRTINNGCVPGRRVQGSFPWRAIRGILHEKGNVAQIIM